MENTPSQRGQPASTEELAAKPAARADLSWGGLLLGCLAVAAIHALVLYWLAPNACGMSERAAYILATTAKIYFFAALLIVPLHVIGKRFTSGYQAPRKLVLVWGAIFTAAVLVWYAQQWLSARQDLQNRQPALRQLSQAPERAPQCVRFDR